jgi:hypothetical protein
MIAPTERPVMLPALLLAGASVDLSEPTMGLRPLALGAAAVPAARWLPWVLAAAVLARIAAKVLVGLAVIALVPRVRRAGPRLGLGLTSAGALSMSIGLTFALRFPGPIGGSVLAAAALATVVGEIVGPASLRACLRRAGEVAEPVTAAPTPAAPPAPPAEPEASSPDPVAEAEPS